MISLRKIIQRLVVGLDSNSKNDINELVKEVNECKRRLLFLESLMNDVYSIVPIEPKYCPICNSELRGFLPFGVKLRPNAQCPKCKSLERHRLMYLYFKEKTNIFTENIRMLHVAPEKILSDIFKAQSNIEYLSGDLDPTRAMVKIDLQDLRFRDDEFDVIYCSHVLEHVPDDRKAMAELCRVLKPGGWAIIQVPIRYNVKKTVEDPKFNTPELRLKHYGQEDHLRYYGTDYKDRLIEAGFIVHVDNYSQRLDAETVIRYGLPQRQDIFFCEKK